MIPNQKVTIRWTYFVKSYYESFGYVFTKNNDEFEIDVCHLPKNSTKKIKVICDFCKKEFTSSYIDVMKQMNSGVKNIWHCKKCRGEYLKKVFQEKYGVNSPMQIPDVKQKMKRTNIEKYGAECVFSSKQIMKKIEKTNLEKYGTKCTLSVPEFRQKAHQTMIKRYGHAYPIQNDELKNKILDNRAETLSKNQKVFTSKQQLYLANLFHGKVNVPCSKFLVDIVVDKIAIEYDGGGHCLDLKFGKITQKEYDKSVYIRDNVLKSHGYKIIRFICENDKLLEDAQLLKLFHFSKNYLLKTSHTWIKIYMNDSIVECDERTISFSEIF